jgi:hypothetical protein
VQNVGIYNNIFRFWPLAMPFLYAFFELEKTADLLDEFFLDIEKARNNQSN